ncbi:MAG: hypothetical protein OEY81_06630 [Candidatus Bathyarchaeota archaeon]|nr:hypothetical protein [Candidatus Bathyarchaeota archaeon]
MSEESVVVICSNPKCRREIEEPILLTILSVTPPKEYEACPYCFANLEPEPPIEQKDVPEPTVDQEEVMEEEVTPTIKSVNSVLEKAKDSGPRFLKKFKALIPSSNGSQKEKRKKTEDPQAEPPTKEEKVTKKEPKTEPSDKKESGSSGCPEAFGYLANRPKDTPIPQECLVCPKMVDCMLSPRESETS